MKSKQKLLFLFLFSLGFLLIISGYIFTPDVVAKYIKNVELEPKGSASSLTTIPGMVRNRFAGNWKRNTTS
jgi:hypothetical protein